MELKFDILYIRSAKFTFFESKIGRYTYEPVIQPEIKQFLKENPIEKFIDLEEPEYQSLQLFQFQRPGGITATNEYSPIYIEINQAAVPYKYLSKIRAGGVFNETIHELMQIIRKSGKVYFRQIELKESVSSSGLKHVGLQIETCLGNGVVFEQEPISSGYAERSSHFRHCRQTNLGTI